MMAKESVDSDIISVIFDDKDFLNSKYISNIKIENSSNLEDLIYSFREVIKDQAGECICPLSILEKLQNSRIVSSGIKSLDCVLNDGLTLGNIYEIRGLSAVGKSQLCMTISANVAYEYETDVHFIDSGGNFSAKRVLEIFKLKSRKSNIKKYMERLKVTRVTNIYELTTILSDISQKGVPNNCRLIVIDSLTAVYLPLMSSSTTNGLALLNHLATLMKYISVKYDVAFLITSLSTTTSINSEGFLNEAKSILGKYWLHVANTRFSLSERDRNDNTVVLSVVHSDLIKVGTSCALRISENGVTDL